MERIQIEPKLQARVNAIIKSVTSANLITSLKATSMTQDSCKCGGDGWIKYFLDNGALAVKECPCMDAKRARTQFERSGIAKYGFKDFEEYSQQVTKAKEMAIQYTKEYQENKSSIALIGQPGSGKTRLASAICNNLMATQMVSVTYALYTEIMPNLKQMVVDDAENYNREMSRLKNAELLFIDDLFKCYSNTDIKYIFDIINHRYLKGKKMIITSEYLRNDLLKIDEAVGRRILEMCKGFTIELIGENLNYSLRQNAKF